MDLRQPATRLQISANGRTTSLGDHDTQEAAAAAFDRAAINKDGAAARTNFDRDNYAAEMIVLTGELSLCTTHCRPAQPSDPTLGESAHS